MCDLWVVKEPVLHWGNGNRDGLGYSSDFTRWHRLYSSYNTADTLNLKQNGEYKWYVSSLYNQTLRQGYFRTAFWIIPSTSYISKRTLNGYVCGTIIYMTLKNQAAHQTKPQRGNSPFQDESHLTPVCLQQYLQT